MNLNMNEIGNNKVQLSDSSYKRLRHFWEQGPLVLVFPRHYG